MVQGSLPSPLQCFHGNNNLFPPLYPSLLCHFLFCVLSVFLALISLFPEHTQARSSLQLELFGPLCGSFLGGCRICWFLQFRALPIVESVIDLSELVNADHKPI